MAAPSYNDVWRFARALARVSTKARDEFTMAMGVIDFTDVDSAMEQVAEVARRIAEKYGPAARELAAQWYDYCRELAIGRGYTAGIGEGSRYSLNSDVGAATSAYIRGEITEEELRARLAGVMVSQMHKEARDTILSNLADENNRAAEAGDKELQSKIGFCRVPTAGACAFCTLLASRSFYPWQQYRSTRSAGEAKKYHDDCRCVIMPFHSAMAIGGYADKLDKYNSQYRDADNARRSGTMPDGSPMPDELKARIAAAKAEHRARYDAGEVTEPWRSINEDLIIMRELNQGMK